MARPTNKLTVRQVAALKEPGIYGDGGNLYLRIDANRRRWIYAFVLNGKRREMGLGGYPEIGLAEARAARDRARAMVRDGIDPIAQRRAESQPAKTIPTFGEFADELVRGMESSWRSEKHRQQWRSTLGPKLCGPIRNKRLDEIGTDDVLATLQNPWKLTPETARRLRGRIEHVLAAATVRGYRSGPNPALWRGHLQLLLPKPPKAARDAHHPAMNYKDVPAFYSRLVDRDELAARALQLIILTAARRGEVLNAAWSEFDLTGAVWIIPDTRMKAGYEHRVPLSSAALGIVKELQAARDPHSEYVFAGHKRGRPLSGTSVDNLLKRMKVTGITIHGFRSSYRNWAHEKTDFAFEVVEQSLAHTVGNAVTKAYLRGDALEKRRQLAQAWCDYVVGGGDGD